MEGRLTLPMAMRHPGMFLSHPGMAMFASYHCPPMTVSIESAMTSRDCSENDMPVHARTKVMKRSQLGRRSKRTLSCRSHAWVCGGGRNVRGQVPCAFLQCNCFVLYTRVQTSPVACMIFSIILVKANFAERSHRVWRLQGYFMRGCRQALTRRAHAKHSRAPTWVTVFNGRHQQSDT